MRGHQDNDVEIDKLSSKSKLNIMADDLAGVFQQLHGKYIPLAPLFPSCPAVLNIGGISITGNYRQRIQTAFMEPEYIGHLMEKFKWRVETVMMIAWKCLRLARPRLNQTVLTTKIINDILPNAKRLHRMGSHPLPLCSECDETETFNHILQCNSKPRQQWCSSYMCALRRLLLEANTHDDIIQCLIECLDQWFKCGVACPSHHPDEFYEAV